MLLSSLQEDNLDCLNYINDAIKYKLVVDVCSSAFYRVGEFDVGWYRFTYDPKCTIFSNKYFIVADTVAMYYFDVVYKGDASHHIYDCNNLVAKSKDNDFVGTREHKWAGHDVVEKALLQRVVS